MSEPMHVVVLTYTVGLDEIDAAISEHAAWLDANYTDGTFLASGRRDPRVGGVILVRGVARDELDSRLALDPFHLRGFATYEVTTFVPSRTAAGGGPATG